MIEFIKLNSEKPFQLFKSKYDEALKAGQKDIEAICISSYSNVTNEVNSRFVNLKQVIGKDFIFFSNYQSQKASEFENHNQISSVFFWNNINLQIRFKAVITKTEKLFSDEYFAKRSTGKNALAISSKQSKKIDSYKNIESNFEETKLTKDLQIRPNYWGGYSFSPTYIEFWEGHKHRINKRDVYELKQGKWSHFILQP